MQHQAELDQIREAGIIIMRKSERPAATELLSLIGNMKAKNFVTRRRLQNAISRAEAAGIEFTDKEADSIAAAYEVAMHPTLPITDAGKEGQIVQCPECQQMELWSDDELRLHGKCRNHGRPCPICYPGE